MQTLELNGSVWYTNLYCHGTDLLDLLHDILGAKFSPLDERENLFNIFYRLQNVSKSFLILSLLFLPDEFHFTLSTMQLGVIGNLDEECQLQCDQGTIAKRV